MLVSDLDAENKARVVEIRKTARARHRADIRQRALRNLVQSWPLAAGLVLACFAPWLRDLAGWFDPWGTWILLPAVSVVSSKQLSLGPEAKAFAWQFALYAQFPIEGVIIKSVLKGQVNWVAVVTQLAAFHILAAFFLWLLSRS
jgi:hypothetical protein